MSRDRCYNTSAPHGLISLSCRSRVRLLAALLTMLLVSCLAAPFALAQRADSAPAEPSRSATADQTGTPPAPGKQLVSIDFNNVEIGVFIKFISDLTKKNFVVDDKVRGRVTVISPSQITVAEAYEVFLSVLEVYGLATVQAGKIVKIIPAPDARTKSIKTRLEEESGEANDTVVTQIIPLRYADPEEIKRLFTPLVSRNSVILSYQPTNTLIITDVHSNIKRLLHILKAIDITGVGQQIAIIPVEYADSAKLVTLLNTIFKAPAKGKAPESQNLTFVADERTNVIVLLASEGELDNIRRLVKILDKETPKTQSRIHVYYLENAPAEDLAKVLMDLPQKAGAVDAKEGGKPSAPVVSDKVRITADKATNSLIIMADMEDYMTLEGIIRKIDIPRAMVYIEALIMEVSVDKDFRLGTEWIVGSEGSYNGNNFAFGTGFSGGTTGGDQGYQAVGSAINPVTGDRVALLPPGFTMGLFGETLSIAGIDFPSISAIIQAYKKDRDVRILSTPQILTTDNQEAKIYVGQNVPFQTTATASSTGTEIYNSFEYRDVGKSLKITPLISKDRMVRLTMALEVTDLQSATDNRPTTLKRTVETTAIVKDGHTVVLGGLIDDKDGLTEYRVPCLGDVPLLGWVFRSRAKSSNRSNLYVFLTPRVIQNPDEARQVSSTKRNEIDKLQEDLIELYSGRSKQPPSQDLPAVVRNSGAAESEPSATHAAAAVDERDADPPNGSTGQTPAMSSAPPADDRDRISSPLPAAESTADDLKQEARLLPEKSLSEESLPQDLPEVSADAARDSRSMQPIHGFTIQVASMQNRETVDKMIAELIGMGFAAYAVRVDIEGKNWYRLRVGFFNTRTEAEQVISRLRDLQYAPILLELQ